MMIPIEKLHEIANILILGYLFKRILYTVCDLIDKGADDITLDDMVDDVVLYGAFAIVALIVYIFVKGIV